MTDVHETQPLIDVQNLHVHFPAAHRGIVKAVDGVTLRVKPGQTLGIIGESGSGKSTLGRALVGLVRPTSGHVLHQGVDPFAMRRGEFASHRRDYVTVFQDPNSVLNPRMTIGASIREPLDIAGLLPRSQRDERALELLERVGLNRDYASRYPHEVSGGQKQRVNIARALASNPKLIVCDEVVAALDVSIQADILNLFLDLQRAFNLTYVFISHDLGVVSHVSDQIGVMYLGKLIECGPAEQLMRDPRHPYTQALLSAEPCAMPVAFRKKKRIILKGEIPSPMNPPKGCRFRTRCWMARDVCSTEPLLREIAPGQQAACHFADTTGLPVGAVETAAYVGAGA